MTDKKHQRQKTQGNHQTSQSTFGLNNSGSGMNLFPTSSAGVGPQLNSHNSSQKKNQYSKGFQPSSFKNPTTGDSLTTFKSIFDDPTEESRYLKLLMKEKFKIFENDEQNKKRGNVLETLSELIQKWHLELALESKKVSKEDAETYHALVLPFGSYKMGVQFPQTDMDLICVFPLYVQQDDFFKKFKQILLERKEEFQDVIDVTDARIPILKLKYQGYQIDLLYASVEQKFMGNKKQLQKQIKDEVFFDKLSQVSQNSLDGFRATSNLMHSVPVIKRFRNTLRAVKLWAMRRGIYSNTFGYLGGVSYAIMVAKICQENPDLDIADLLYKYFEVYCDWKWLDAVYIKIFKKKDKLNLNALQVLDGYSQDIMPILTPTANPKNSAYRVCQFTFYTIQKEFQRAKTIIKSQIAPVSLKHVVTQDQALEVLYEEIKGTEVYVQPEVSDKKLVKWTKLFKKVRFFSLYKHYIKIDILSNEDESHQKWVGYVESQLRRLLQLFQDIETISDLRIYPRCFTREETDDNINGQFRCCDTYFMGFKVHEMQGGSVVVNLRDQIKDFCNWLEIGRVKKSLNNVRILHLNRDQIPQQLIDNF